MLVRSFTLNVLNWGSDWTGVTEKMPSVGDPVNQNDPCLLPWPPRRLNSFSGLVWASIRARLD